MITQFISRFKKVPIKKLIDSIEEDFNNTESSLIIDKQISLKANIPLMHIDEQQYEDEFDLMHTDELPQNLRSPS